MTIETLKKILVEKGFLTGEQWEESLSTQRETGSRVDRILVENGYVPEEEMLKSLSTLLGVPYLSEIDGESVEPSIIGTFSEPFLRQNRCFPLRCENGFVTVATSDPLNTEILNEIGVILGSGVKVVVVLEEELGRAIEKFYGSRENTAEKMLQDMEGVESAAEAGEESEELLDLANKAPIIRLVNLILFQAVKERASDIHIQPYEKELRVRYRVDGILHDVLTPPKRYQAAIISRIKVMAKLNIAERRLPQDGRATIKVDDRQIDIRISIIPTAFGERVVMRLLDKENLFFGLEELGLSSDKLAAVNRLIHSSHGIILVTGPTGSGKTTTLYAALSKINSPDRNIITVEDPIEYQLPGISQIQVKPKIGLTFASGLRHIVRQDPDIIMVGEIRDVETAEIAIHASLTGHLVFSTLHTNDASGAVTRLLDMGIEPYLISSSVIAVVAQRLVRLICEKCREPYNPDEEALAEIGLKKEDVGTLSRGKGCQNCLNTGYSGRTGIYEAVVINEELRKLILDRADSNTIRKKAFESGMESLRSDGAAKVLKGITTIEEVLRVTQEN
jgi:general secretion pathway protein E